MLLANLCEEHGISPVPKLIWSTRMKKTLGLAYIGRNLIKLSSWLNADQAQSTLRHELAHIATGNIRNHKPHGARWQRWAVALGAPPTRSSVHGPANVPRKTISPAVWGLECPKCGLRIARIRVRGGLYHRVCGPKTGLLIRTVKDSAERVASWITLAIGKSEKTYRA